MAVPPILTFVGEFVAVDGVPLQGRVALFGVTRKVAEEDSYVSVASHGRGLEATAAKPTVSFAPTPGESVARNSIWAAVELAKGEYAVAAPPGVAVQQIETGSTEIYQGGGSSDGLTQERACLYVFLARAAAPASPGGAWRAYACDNSPADADGEPNGRLSADIADFTPVDGSGPAPSRFANRDVLVAVDPETLEYFLTRVEVKP